MIYSNTQILFKFLSSKLTIQNTFSEIPLVHTLLSLILQIRNKNKANNQSQN